MSRAAENIGNQALQLPPEERAALIERLLDSLDEPDPSLDGLWAREAEDRLSAYKRGDVPASRLSEVLAKYQRTSGE